jgi:transposase-like protein
MKTVSKYSPEFRERAVRMVFEHQGEHKTQWAAIVSIASKIGCAAETLRKWVRQAEQGQRDGLSSSERDRLKQLEREAPERQRLFLPRRNSTANQSDDFLYRPTSE